MFDVERWNNWDYPSHYQFDESFSTLEDALAYVKEQNDPNEYRIINVVWEKD